MSTVENVPFRLVGIETEQFAVIKENFEEGVDLGFNIESGFGLNTEVCLLQTILKVTYGSLGKPAVILQVAVSFQIKEITFQSFKNEEGGYVFPIGLIRHLCVLSTGTLRGVLHAKLESQKGVIPTVILPTINVNELITEDVKFNSEEI